jgi:MurNAc alpha-1-phosphate uridylyltransferase
MGALLLLTPLAKAQARSAPGDFRMDGDGRIALGGDLVYTGVQIIDAALADEIEEETFSMHRLWDLCAARGGLFGAVYDGGWCDVGTAKGLSRAEELIRENSV